MAKMYYNLEETLARLGCTEEQLKGLVREGKLREFRDAGKLNYRVEEVDRLMGGETGGGATAPEAEDIGEIPLAPIDEETGGKPVPAGGPAPVPELGGSDAPVDLASGSGPLSLELGSGELKLEDSGAGTGDETSLEDSGGGTGGLTLEDSGSASGSGADIVSLDEVDKDAVEGMKKDDTVITNIGISVFDDDDLEIAADPMAKTLMTGGDEHLGLDGSGGGSGLLDLTRESDDTSLGAELLEGIDMGDTAEAVVEPAAAAEPAGPMEEVVEAGPEADMGPMVTAVSARASGMAELASPAFTGLLIAGALVMALAGAVNVAMSLDAWPAYLGVLSEQFWILLGAGVGAGALFALIGWLVGRQSSGPRSPKRPRGQKGKKKGKKKNSQVGIGGEGPEAAG